MIHYIPSVFTGGPEDKVRPRLPTVPSWFFMGVCVCVCVCLQGRCVLRQRHAASRRRGQRCPSRRESALQERPRAHARAPLRGRAGQVIPIPPTVKLNIHQNKTKFVFFTRGMSLCPSPQGQSALRRGRSHGDPSPPGRLRPPPPPQPPAVLGHPSQGAAAALQPPQDGGPPGLNGEPRETPAHHLRRLRGRCWCRRRRWWPPRPQGAQREPLPEVLPEVLTMRHAPRQPGRSQDAGGGGAGGGEGGAGGGGAVGICSTDVM